MSKPNDVLIQEELERRILHGLSCEWENAFWALKAVHRAKLTRPVFSLADMNGQWGYWAEAREEICLSRRLVLGYSWSAVREILLHEMAHQFTSQVFRGPDETPHGPCFQEACHILRANPRATGDFKPLDDRIAHGEADPEERIRLATIVEEMNNLDSEAIVERYLRPSSNPGVPDPNIPTDDPDAPDLLKLTPQEIIQKLDHLHSGYSITLGLSGLSIEDVLELLYDCRGKITHLENFNLKDYSLGRDRHYQQINEFQRAINDGNVIVLKRSILDVIKRLETSYYEDRQDRIEKLKAILHDIESFQSYYRGSRLKSRVGSDSAGRSHHLYGMGMAIKDTLPLQAQREIEKSSAASRLTVPVNTGVYLQVNYLPEQGFAVQAFQG